VADRRHFLKNISLAGVGLLAGRVWAAALAMVSETDPTAVGLGYKAKASEVDKAKYPKYASGQQCGNCALFQSKAGDAAGPCPLYAGKQVAAGGWCSAYNKKAG